VKEPNTQLHDYMWIGDKNRLPSALQLNFSRTDNTQSEAPEEATIKTIRTRLDSSGKPEEED